VTEPAPLEIGYRDQGWIWVLFWPVLLGLYWLWTHNLAISESWSWWLGMGLAEAVTVLTLLRSRRGLTLAADGITWHKHALFLPWTNVSETKLSDDGRRLLIQVIESDQALEGQSPTGRAEVRTNLRRFGSPVALHADRLTVPAEQVISEATKLRERYEGAQGKFAGFGLGVVPPELRRAVRSARLRGRAVLAALLLMAASVLMTCQSTPQGFGLDFTFRSHSEPGTMDQVLEIKNYGGQPVAPFLAIVALDDNGNKLPDVGVRTAYGSDQGLVVIPGGDTGIDVLLFSGAQARHVQDVRVTVRREIKLPPTSGLLANDYPAQITLPTVQRTDEHGTEVAPLRPFTSVTVANPNPIPVQVRVVCIMWEQPPPGAPQQMLAAYPIGDLNTVGANSTTSVPVANPLQNISHNCGSVKVYFSR